MNKTFNEIGSKIESSNFAQNFLKKQRQFTPPVDYSTASNFVYFGLAEKYYEDSIKRIYRTFPYDGSRSEKEEWFHQSSGLDRYIFDNLYPRTNGFITIGNNWGIEVQSFNDYAAPATSSYEYIQIKGGPNLGFDLAGDRKTYKKAKSIFENSNKYDETKKRRSNLEFDVTGTYSGSNNGVTVEFWLKKDGFPASGTQPTKEVLFDLWNGRASGSHDYGRLTIETNSTASNSPFRLTMISGTTGISYQEIGSGITTSTVGGNTWNHYAFTFHNNSDSELETNLFVNGNLNDTNVAASQAIGRVTGSLIANIGALRTAPSGTQGPAEGYGKLLSASLDEFRFWKVQRTGEQINQFWNDVVGGGANTDDETTTLGVYYKFNEGITQTSSVDSVVLDYSGRVANGTWTGYAQALTPRATGSAIVEATASLYETQDPIIYSFHNDVQTLLIGMMNSGSNYDETNTVALWKTFPEWIINQDAVEGTGELKNLTQILASSLDKTYLLIEFLTKYKNIEYRGDKTEQLSFIKSLLKEYDFVTHDIFDDATVSELFLNKGKEKHFEETVEKVKNTIYQNIYNNIVHIYKQKGTNDSFRNLLRCFGIGSELVRLNLYSDGEGYEFKDNFEYTSRPKNVVNFYSPNNFGATVFQTTSSVDATNMKSFISASTTPSKNDFVPFTLETEFIFPNQKVASSKNYLPVNFLSSSLFGLYPALSTNEADLTWQTPNTASFQVYAVKERRDSKRAKFVLTGSVVGEFPVLTSSFYPDVYDEDKWNFAVSVRHNKYPYSNTLSGSALSGEGSYILEFYGVNTVLDVVPKVGVMNKTFYLTSSLTYEQGSSFLRSDKRIYAGALRTNFTGSVITETDVQLSNVRAWLNYLPTSSVINHSKFDDNHGISDVYGNFLTYDSNNEQLYIPNSETLVLDWRFSSNTGSNASGEFYVYDESSGSNAKTSRYGEFGARVGYNYPATGFGFVTNNTGSFELKYLPTLKQKLPETNNSFDMVQVLDEDTEVYTKDTRPSAYVFRIEKSMNQAISEDIVKYFDTILEYNNVIGQPVNRYRPSYKKLDKLRNLYFENVENEPDLERFFEFYKWIDSSILKMLNQLFPASVNSSEPILDVVESHILERNKFQHKFPLLEIKTSTSGNVSVLPRYSWKDTHAPVDLNEEENGRWWNRLSTLDSTIWNNSTDIVNNRVSIAKIKSEEYVRDSKNPFSFQVNEQISIGGGINFPKSRRFAYTDLLYPLRDNNSLIVSGSTLIEPRSEYNTKLRDGREHPIANKKYKFSVINPNEGLSGSSNILAPFTIISSSVSGVLANQNSLNLAVVDLHHDQYNQGRPVQGPFTSEHVGGYQWRHVTLNTSSDDRSIRPEKFSGEVVGNDFVLYASDYNGLNNPRADFSRDGLAKRYINVKNIKTSGSVRVLGNYSNNYEVINATGRTENNIYNRRNVGISGTLVASSSIANGLIDYIPPRRDLTGSKSIIAVTFDAPGGVETARSFRDPEASEFSVYNSMPWRNYRNRTLLNEIHTSASFQYGIDDVTSPISASDHKVPRNTFYRIKSSGSSFVTASIKNNWFYQSAIPASDLGYTWIRKSAVTASHLAIDNQNIPFRYSSASLSDGKHRTIEFLEKSPFGVYRNVISNHKFFGTNVENSGPDFTPIDYVNLNTIIYEPISSSENTLGYASLVALDTNEDLTDYSVNYINKDIVTGDGNEETKNSFSGLTPGLASLLNSLVGHRHGVGGFDLWKQTRMANHPISRFMRRNNLFSVIKEPEPIAHGEKLFTPLKAFEHENFYESTVDLSSNPLETIFELSGNLVSFKNSYANVVNFFANERLNVDATDKKNKPIYQKLKNLYLTDEPQQRFVGLRYRETVFPQRKYANLAKTRGRTSYAESGGYGQNGIDRNTLERRSFWPKTLERTSITGSTPFKNAVNSSWGRSAYVFGNEYVWSQETAPIPPPTPWLFVSPIYKTGSYSGELSIYSTSSADAVPYVDANLQGLLGQPQSFLSGSTSTSSLPSDFYDYPTASLQYVYLPNLGKFTEYTWPDDVHRQAGRGAWFDSYEDYAKDVRYMGQGYSTIGEYKISDHIENYVDSGFFQENKDWLSNAGSYVSASSDSSTGSYVDEFFEQYTNSELLEHFNYFLEDHRSIGAKPTHLKLVCSAVKKLLPYNGFYPTTRTAQLGGLFSQSLGPYISGSFYNETNSSSLALQSLLQPYFAPGLVFNTIKSGIAVDWPFFTGSSNNDEVNAVWRKNKNDAGGVAYDAFVLNISSSGFEANLSGQPVDDWWAFLLSSSYDANTGGPGKFHGRLPFESLVGVDNTLLSGTNIYLMAPDKINQPSASANTRYPYFNWNGEKSPYFEMAMNNFLSEVPNFFLKNKNFSSFVSKPEKNFKPMEVNKTYYMDVILKKTTDMNMVISHFSSSVPSGASALAGTAQSYNGRYFGPPSFARDQVNATYPTVLNSEELDVRAYRMADPAYAPFTPPYFYGPAKARLSFTPTETRKYSIDEIFANCISSGSQVLPTDLTTELSHFAQNNAMQLKSSVNLFLKENALDAPDSTGLDSWKIVPKFECPTLNFTKDSSEGQNPDSGYQNVYQGRGMWGTYGEIPTGSTGIYISLEESFPEDVYSDTTGSTNIGSLIDICGFSPSQKRIGELADSKTIHEAIVAIPYVLRDIPNGISIANRNFLKIDGNVLKEKGNSVEHMLTRIKNYYLPPFMDFTNPDSDIDPFIFYLFEFDETLDKQDLADVWQGVMPKPALKASKQTITVKHPISDSEAFFGHGVYPDMRWLVFKVKRRARRSYSDLFESGRDELVGDVNRLIENYNYNWPYDYFSLVELVKFDVEVELGK